MHRAVPREGQSPEGRGPGMDVAFVATPSHQARLHAHKPSQCTTCILWRDFPVFVALLLGKQ